LETVPFFEQSSNVYRIKWRYFPEDGIFRRLQFEELKIQLALNVHKLHNVVKHHNKEDGKVNNELEVMWDEEVVAHLSELSRKLIEVTE
jgi:hypothetical protein